MAARTCCCKLVTSVTLVNVCRAIIVIYLITYVQAVSKNRVDKLSREDLLELDREVSRFYETKYEILDTRNVSYDEQLFRMLRAIRHTTVIHPFDFKYTDDSIIDRALGSKPNSDLCKTQLRILKKMAIVRQERSIDVPLSVMNFLESSGQAESGILNGNFVWLGSYASCARANIPAKTVQRFLDPASHSDQVQDIKGRYCIAHLRAKSWPKWDIYFEDRLTIRKGICLPETCHTKFHREDGQIKQLVDRLARHDLSAPYNDDERYETDELFCLPDEDSPHRQLDLGTKSFVGFVFLWVVITLYTNYKYRQRQEAVRRLRDIVDIKMIVSDTCNPNDSGEDNEDSTSSTDEVHERQRQNVSKRDHANNNLAKQCSTSDEAGSQSSSSTGKSGEYRHERTFDLWKAFSIECNVEYLFKSRPNLYKTSSGFVRNMRQREQPSDQQQHSSAQQVDAQRHQAADSSKITRVDTSVLDGLKVFGTMYIVFGHTLMFLFGVLYDMRFADERMFDAVMIASINGLQVVGLFYIIAGILLTYLTFSKQKRKQLLRPSFWILVMFGRYCRLIPTYLLVFWFARHVAPYTGEGPGFVDYRTDIEHTRGYCGQESWLTMLTLSAADAKIPMGCIPQAWYLSNDFRTLLVLPIYVIILAMNYKAGYAAVLSTITYSTLRMIGSLREAAIDYKIMLKWQPHVYSLMADRLHDVYTDFGIRMSTYMMSVIVGHLLYLYESRQIKRWPKWFKDWALKVSLTVVFTLFFGAPILASPILSGLMPDLDKLSSDSIVLLVPLFKFAMESSICVILLCLMTGGGYQWIREAFSSRAFKILSEISYAVFLIHIEIMYKLPQTKYASSYWYLFIHASFFIITSYLLATLIYILYEMPINNILREVFRRALNYISSGL